MSFIGGMGPVPKPRVVLGLSLLLLLEDARGGWMGGWGGGWFMY
jgi:hypothetical protein